LPNFLKDPKNAPVEPFKFKACTKAEFGSIDPSVTMYPVTSTGMILLNSFLAHAVKNFRKGLSWKGEFKKEDMIVIDGVLCRINKNPGYSICLSYLILDLDQIIKHLLSEFKSFPEPPPYIAHLENVLKNPPADFDSNPASRDSFFKKMTSNAALSTDAARMMVLINMDQYLDDNGLEATVRERPSIDPDFDPVLDELKYPPSLKPPATNPNQVEPEWVDIAHSDPQFDDFYWDGKPKIGERYTATCLNMIKHVRHFFINAPGKTMVLFSLAILYFTC
jgi:hypothetical protein